MTPATMKKGGYDSANNSGRLGEPGWCQPLRHGGAIAIETRLGAMIEIAGQESDAPEALLEQMAGGSMARTLLRHADVDIDGVLREFERFDHRKMRLGEKLPCQRRVMNASDDDGLDPLSDQRLDRVFLLDLRIAAVDDDDLKTGIDQHLVKREQIFGKYDIVERRRDDADGIEQIDLGFNLVPRQSTSG